MARDITQLHPKLQEKWKTLVKKCAEQGISIKYSECLRTVAEQDALYAKGRTDKSSGIVTNAKGSSYSSQHQWGIAVDFYLDMDIDGDGQKADDAFNDSKNHFAKVGKIAKSIGLGWGGDWISIKDTPHLYLPQWGSTTTKLKSQYQTPDKFFRTWKTASSTTITFEKPSTAWIKEVQEILGAKVDGIAGTETLSKTVKISRKTNARHKVVKLLQKRLNDLGYNCGKADGIFGTKTANAVKALQKDMGVKQEGWLGKGQVTWKVLLGLKTK